jgi:hypothetical protein
VLVACGLGQHLQAFFLGPHRVHVECGHVPTDMHACTRACLDCRSEYRTSALSCTTTRHSTDT